MVKVKNNYSSHIGFGAMRILPGETEPLPTGYGLNHPVVQFYIRKKWLEVVREKKKADEPVLPAKVADENTDTGKTDGGSGENDIDAGKKDGEDDEDFLEINTGDPDGDETDGELSLSAGNGETITLTKPLSRMNRGELMAVATGLGIEFPANATNPVLLDLIREAQKNNA